MIYVHRNDWVNHHEIKMSDYTYCTECIKSDSLQFKYHVDIYKCLVHSAIDFMKGATIRRISQANRYMCDVNGYIVFVYKVLCTIAFIYE